MRKTFIVSLLILLGLSQIGAAQAANTNALSNGMQLYQNGQYNDALSQFLSLARVDHRNPALHYLIAITFVKLNALDAAINEYRDTISLDPNGTYGRRARLGVQALTAQAPGGYIPANGYAPPATNGKVSTVADAMGAINQQANIAEQAKRSDVQAAVHDVNETTAGTASNLAKKRDAITEDMASASYITPHGHLIPMYNPSQIAAVQDHFNNRISNVQQQGTADAAQAQVNGNQTVSALRDSVDNLYSQLQEPSTNGVRLVPQGTNLYVRNYSSN